MSTGSVIEGGSVAAETLPECRWSDWSSCSYYCGDPRVETRFKSLVEVVPKGEAAQCEIPQEKCAVSCTGEDPCTQKPRYELCFPSEPFIFGPWMTTEFCTETCGGEGRLLEQRSCTPLHPDKSCASLSSDQTLRPGNKTCGEGQCEGNYHYIDSSIINCNHRNLHQMVRLV